MITQNTYTPSFSQKHLLSPDSSIFSVNGSVSHSEYLLTQYKKDRFALLQEMTFELLKVSHFSNLLFSNFLEKPFTELKNKICNVYQKHQEEKWDGYEAEPMKYLNESLKFAEDLFSESRTLIESVDVIPENDGCLCFDWFKSHSKYMTISVKDNKLIYTYKLGDEEDCGETTFSGKKDLIEKLKKII